MNINGKISNWAEIGIEIWKFADDTKICKNIKNERDVEQWKY